VPRILGLMAASQGESEAEAHFETALDVATATGARVELARTQIDYGRLLARRSGSGNRQRAMDLSSRPSLSSRTWVCGLSLPS
jgi:hypothetical protein